jgi:hypothetical protein
MKSIKLLLASAALFLSVTACMAVSNAVSTAQSQETGAPLSTEVPQSTEAPQATEPQTGSSGLITEVVLAKDSDPVSAAPVDPTTVFDSNSVIHATVKISDAPAGTKFTATWYTVDVGSAAPANTQISTTDLTADGTRYMDFTLTPTSAWPSGKYRVEISVNGEFDQVATYTVQ